MIHDENLSLCSSHEPVHFISLLKHVLVPAISCALALQAPMYSSMLCHKTLMILTKEPRALLYHFEVATDAGAGPSNEQSSRTSRSLTGVISTGSFCIGSWQSCHHSGYLAFCQMHRQTESPHQSVLLALTQLETKPRQWCLDFFCFAAFTYRPLLSPCCSAYVFTHELCKQVTQGLSFRNGVRTDGTSRAFARAPQVHCPSAYRAM